MRMERRIADALGVVERKEFVWTPSDRNCVEPDVAHVVVERDRLL
jgi:hypothetical protein